MFLGHWGKVRQDIPFISTLVVKCIPLLMEEEIYGGLRCCHFIERVVIDVTPQGHVGQDKRPVDVPCIPHILPSSLMFKTSAFIQIMLFFSSLVLLPRAPGTLPILPACSFQTSSDRDSVDFCESLSIHFPIKLLY